MSINLFCYTELEHEAANNLNGLVSQDALFVNEDFLIYKAREYNNEILEVIGIYIGDYNPRSYFLVYLRNKDKGFELRYVANLIAKIYEKNVLVLYENEIIWNKPFE